MRYSLSSLFGLALLTLAVAAAAADEPPGKKTAKMTSSGDLEIDGKTIDQWISQTRNPDPAVREVAVQRIGEFPEDLKKKAIPALIPRLMDSDSPARARDRDDGVAGRTIVTLQSIRLDPAEIGQDEFDKLLNGLVYNLQSGTMYARLQAAACIGNIGPLASKKAVHPLVTELSRATFSWEVRKACAYALGRVGYNAKKDPQTGVVQLEPDMLVVRPLLLALTDKCGEVRLQALSSLDTLGFPKEAADKGRVKTALLSVIRNDRNKVIGIWARVLLIRMDTEAGHAPREIATNIEKIADELEKDPDPQNRSHAALALGRIGPAAKGKIRVLLAALRDPQPAVAASAVASLGMLKKYLDEKDIRAVLKNLDPMESPEIRARAAQTLGVVGASALIPRLIDLLNDPDEAVAVAATGALAQMKDSLSKDQIDAISRMLTDTTQKLATRCRAAAALGAIGQRSQIPKLVEALKDKDSFVSSAAVSGLADMKDQLSATDVGAIKKVALDKDKLVETRCHAVQLLGLLGGKAKVHLPDLIGLLKEKETNLVLYTILALAQMGKDAQPAVPALQEVEKQHRETYVRQAAGKAITEINKQLEKASK